MAKVRQNNFLDTVDEVFTNAKNAGVLHLHAGGTKFDGRTIEIEGKCHYHFGTTGYLGLEQDPRLKIAAIVAIDKYGTQFPLSKSYISHPLYAELEEKVEEIYDEPIVITKNSTLGHLAVIPTAVRDEDGVVLDHQVHWSVQNATQLLKTRGVPVEMIRHNNLEMLEDKIKKLSGKCKKIWYMADGVYSMYGDYAPVEELMALSQKYPQLHFYFDDVHGMSWRGKNGSGFIRDILGGLPENVLLFGTLSKTFGASGAVAVCSDKRLHSKIKTFGGPLTFSAQLEPASVAAAIASAKIHLSTEIYELQAQLQERIQYFNRLLEDTELPLVRQNNAPVFYIGTGMPISGYNFVRRLMKEGFYVNLGIYPAVPVKNTGVRITISRHNAKEEIKELVSAMVYHFPKALEETNSSPNRVRRAFRMPLQPEEESTTRTLPQKRLQVVHSTTIRQIEKEDWNGMFKGKGAFDWEGQLFLEQVFSGNKLPEHNMSFNYIMIRDERDRIVLATVFSYTIWKDDLLAPASLSLDLEERRKTDPYYLTSPVLSMGSLFTEGAHLYLDKSHPQHIEALEAMLVKVEDLDQELKSSLVVLRDFGADPELNEFFHQHGFVRTAMPESCNISGIGQLDLDSYLEGLSSRSRKHLRKDILPYENKFRVRVEEKPDSAEIEHFFNLYLNVKNNNPGLNTFAFPKKLFYEMGKHPLWEFLVLDLKEENESEGASGVMFCYKNHTTYVPAFIGMKYDKAREYNLYRQLLFQTVKRAISLQFSRIDFGMTAAFEKKKLGAQVEKKFAYIQAKDNYSMELLGTMQNENRSA